MRIELSAEQYRRECRTFTRYLISREPDSYVVQKYVECHIAVLGDAPAMLPIDNVLVQFACGGTLRTRIADAYARIFRPQGLLRRKLVLIFAILENSRAYHREFTSGGDGNLWGAWLRVVGSMAGFVAALAVGIAVFMPQHVFTMGAGKRSRK